MNSYKCKQNAHIDLYVNTEKRPNKSKKSQRNTRMLHQSSESYKNCGFAAVL